jgi:energy-coupling factor transport system substrate-specific component
MSENERTPTGAEPSGNRWKVKDFITLAIFNVILLVITMVVTAVVGLLLPGLSYMVGYAISGLLTGPVYMVMANRINKRGVLLFTAVITGAFYAAMGIVHYLIVFAVGGIICELAMWGKDSYRRVPRNAVGYALLYVFFCLGGVLPLIIFRDSYLTAVGAMYTPEQMEVMLYYYGTPHIVLISCVLAACGAVLGTVVGGVFVRRHIKKAKLV